MGKAIDSALNQWCSLQLFVEDGRLEIDNHLVENAIRLTAIGKKNWLFIGAAAAGQRSAILYTFIECRRCRGLDPFACLRGVFTRRPTMTHWQEEWKHARNFHLAVLEVREGGTPSPTLGTSVLPGTCYRTFLCGEVFYWALRAAWGSAADRTPLLGGRSD